MIGNNINPQNEELEPTVLGYDHYTLWVGNAKQAATYYTVRYGFDYLAYQGLETGERNITTHVLRNSLGTTICLKSVVRQDSSEEINLSLIKHGDTIKDVAFVVSDCRQIHKRSLQNGAIEVRAPREFKDQSGSVIISTIKTFGDLTHSFVQRKNYKGVFLPGFVAHHLHEPINKILSPIIFEKIDHMAFNENEGQMNNTVNFYVNTLNFHRFWSVDDDILKTTSSALRTTVVADFHENIKIPIAEPASRAGRMVSQVQEYINYNGGPGVQHVAFQTKDIITTVQNLRSRGAQFLSTPQSYYDILRKRLPDMSIKVSESIDSLQKNHILIDYDQYGYLLQIFTKPIEDRPTLFLEVIQRNNHSGFGVGNIKSLFQAVQLEQKRRGNLIREEN